MQTFIITIDDIGTVYANETQSFSDTTIGQYSWWNPTTGSLSATRLLAIYAESPLGEIGFVMTTVYGGCLTRSANWKCTTTPYPKWYDNICDKLKKFG